MLPSSFVFSDSVRAKITCHCGFLERRIGARKMSSSSRKKSITENRVALSNQLKRDYAQRGARCTAALIVRYYDFQHWSIASPMQPRCRCHWSLRTALRERLARTLCSNASHERCASAVKCAEIARYTLWVHLDASHRLAQIASQINTRFLQKFIIDQVFRQNVEDF